jgi:5-methylcytosine-specific restriction enzyme B
MLDTTVTDHLKRSYSQLLEQGQLPSREKLKQYYATFRARFGPEVLRHLEGEELLNTIHAHGNKDSLVYWLEFKDDEEFPALFGSIAGGSALKFGIYRRKETGAWMTGSPTEQKELSTIEAIAVARSHRDQLLAGSVVVEALGADPSDASYSDLQDALDRAAPDLSDSSWGHKYFGLLFPDKLDDFHQEEYQHFHIRKMLQEPPEKEGRYAAAGRYVSAAAELQIPLNHLTTMFNRINGRPYKVWRIGTRPDGGDLWPAMRDGGYAAIGWANLGDLSALAADPTVKDRIRKQLEEDGARPNIASGSANQISTFVIRISEDDLVLAADGKDIRGIGKVTGPYEFKMTDAHGAPHHRPVRWLDTSTWQLPETEGLQTTVRQINKYPSNLVEIERRLIYPHPVPTVETIPRTLGSTLAILKPIPARIAAILQRKGQTIVYGPPGTGKTHWAVQSARELAAHAAYGKPFDALDTSGQTEVKGSESNQGLVRACTFHPAYGYEDFIEGYRPVTSVTGQLSFERRDGIFKQLCTDAKKQLDKHFFLVIDEINRGDIPRIFGELITLLEYDKRGSALHLPLSGERFSVPPNVYVIGTMNTADRSIALLDTALRRRFGFVELMPDPNALGNAQVANSIPLGPWLSALNERIRTHIVRDARNLQVGHAYLMEAGKSVTDFARFSRILAEDIFPLLEEYCYENYGLLRNLLGSAIVDEKNQRLRSELFNDDRRDDLIQALRAPFPEISTSTVAIAAESTIVETELEDAPENTD